MKRKRKEGERGPNRNHINSSDISDDWSDVRNAVQTAHNGNERGIEKYSTFNSRREHDKFICADQVEMEFGQDPCSLKTNEPNNLYN